MKMTTSVFMKESRYKKINIKDKFKKNKRILIVALIIIIAIVLDQIIKIAIINNIYKSSITVCSGFLNLTYVENTGGAFGIGSSSTIMFIIVNIIIISMIIRFILLKKEDINMNILISLGLVIAGGIGNLIDRIFRGYVIDYIDISTFIEYPVFNLADIFVVVGCTIIIIYTIYYTVNERQKE